MGDKIGKEKTKQKFLRYLLTLGKNKKFFKKRNYNILLPGSAVNKTGIVIVI